MLKTLTSERIREPVDQVFGKMDFTDEASVFEVNGRRVYFLVRPISEPVTPVLKWTDDQSKRRHHLIDLKLADAISAAELLELARLNDEFERYAGRVAPLPMSEALDLLAKLKAQVNGTP